MADRLPPDSGAPTPADSPDPSVDDGDGELDPRHGDQHEQPLEEQSGERLEEHSGGPAPVALNLSDLVLAARAVAAAGRVRRVVSRLVVVGATAAAVVVLATVLDARLPDLHRPILVVAALAALLPVMAGARYARRLPQSGTAYLVGTAATSALALLGLRLFVRDGSVSWIPLLAFGMLVAAPCWALAGWVARATWRAP